MEKKNKYIIYKAQNTVNNQVYIGATSDSIKQRKWDHTERANRGELCKFQEAISTYGAGAFEWEQIDTASSINELAQKEKFYVLEYKAKEEGYNSDEGGGFKKTVYQYKLQDGSLINSYDCLQDAGNAVNATKQDISRACLSINQTYKGFYWSYEYLEHFKSKNDKRKKEVIQCTIEGKFLAKYNSVSEASRQTEISKTCISRVCRGERANSGGFIWVYI